MRRDGRGVAMMRMRTGLRWAAAGLVLAGLASAAVASSDFNAAVPEWRVAADDLPGVSRPMLAPGNDTRVNLLWLMRSLHPVDDGAAHYPPAAGEYEQLGHSFLTWASLRDTYWPQPKDDAGTFTPPDCTAPAAANAAFAAALAANSAVPAAERAALQALRPRVGCPGFVADAAISSAAGREFVAYLRAAAAFYAHDWAAADREFAEVAQAHDPWLADSAAYMPIRIALERAVEPAAGQYGDFDRAKIDMAAVASAERAIAAYLARRPAGRFAGSARAFLRRVLWLRGDTLALAHVYEHLLESTPPDSAAAADLAEEIDLRLLANDQATAALRTATDLPLLLAVADLRAMRRPADDAAPATRLSAAALAAQAPVFARHGDLYGLLTATQAYYAGDPDRVLATVSEDRTNPGATPLAFSRQVLRAMALSKRGDAGAEAAWTSLIGGVRPLYQRPFAELGLALQWQAQGRVEQVFAPGSPVIDQTIREVLLQTVAPPAILRATAGDTTRPAHERAVARFTLLYKDVSRGAYADGARDLALIPADAPTGTLYDFSGDGVVADGLFVRGKWSDTFPCPALHDTLVRLAAAPQDRAARLCLGDFWRLNGFDGFALFSTGRTFEGARTGPDVLGNLPDHFAGTPLYRDAIYAAIIKAPQATDDERAYALYRAVMCFAPSGSNACGAPYGSGTANALSDDKAQHRLWYNTLKQRYGDSRWARALRYYW